MFELKTIFPRINTKGSKIKISEKIYAVDIFIPELNLIIEYDGSYWHKNKFESDSKKSIDLLAKGYKLIRIREHPLLRVLPTDILVNQPFCTKTIVDRILLAILRMMVLPEGITAQIQNYIDMVGLQNEQALQHYIDNLLKNKARKLKKSDK